MNKELKEQAHKEFDEKFAVKHYTDGKVDIPFGIHEEYRKIIKSFLDSLIDKTVQKTEDRIVGLVEKKMKLTIKRKNEITNDPFHPARCQYLGQEEALKYVISLITNNSEINK